MRKLAIVCTHPIQYNAPWFRLLSERNNVEVKVFYTWSQSQVGAKYDPDFKQVIQWDIPLLEGYQYEFVENISKDPGSHHFYGIINPSLNRQIEKWRAGVVLIIGWAFSSHLGAIRHFKGKVPLLFRGDSTLLDERGGIKTLIRRIFLRWVYHHIDVALYVGTHNKEYFIKHGFRKEQLVFAPHAVDNQRFTSSAQTLSKVEEFKNQLGIKPNHFVLLFAGKFEQKKNPFFFLQLAEKLQDPNFIFLLVGNGYLEKAMKKASGHDKRFRYLGFQNQSIMPSVYRLGHVFILPSRGPGETWGLAANEAMASGLPVIISDKAGGSIDLVKENGLVIENSDVQKTSVYIAELKKDKVLYQKASAASVSAIKKFSFVQIAEAVEYACIM